MTDYATTSSLVAVNDPSSMVQIIISVDSNSSTETTSKLICKAWAINEILQDRVNTKKYDNQEIKTLKRFHLANFLY